MSESETLRLRIRGKVQGVFFRASMQRQARDLGVAGWVRNVPDGTVEAVVSGPAPAVDRLLEWCREGPPAADVRELETEDAPAEEAPDPFEVRYA